MCYLEKQPGYWGGARVYSEPCRRRLGAKHLRRPISRETATRAVERLQSVFVHLCGLNGVQSIGGQNVLHNSWRRRNTRIYRHDTRPSSPRFNAIADKGSSRDHSTHCDEAPTSRTHAARSFSSAGREGCSAKYNRKRQLKNRPGNARDPCTRMVAEHQLW